MEESLLEIAKGCFNEDYSRAKEEDFEADGKIVKVFKVESEDETLFYWNSSNFESIRHSVALKNIGNEILDDDINSTVSDGWNEIMYEIR
jgi:hypothetical protein